MFTQAVLAFQYQYKKFFSLLELHTYKLFIIQMIPLLKAQKNSISSRLCEMNKSQN